MYTPSQMPTVLQQIIKDKKLWVAHQQTLLPLTSFYKEITKSDRLFYQSLRENKPAFILECKKASPSKGLICPNFNLANIAEQYRHYAAVISVLTDEKYFQGHFRYIKKVREMVSQPILCKDFIISEYQVYLARYYQADAILLMLSVLDDRTYQTLAQLAHQLGMGVLTEVADNDQLQRAISLNAKVIGINNRDLHTLSIDINQTLSLAPQIPMDRIIISESGFYTHQQIQQVSPYVNGFLIGSSLMSSTDLNSAIRTLIYGENKVCGLTRPQDVKAVYEQGATYGGLIFAEKSPRKLSLRQAQELVVQAPLRFIGVFQNQPIEFIIQIAKQLNLFAVQLHGQEDENFIATLHQQLAPDCHIWKAISINIYNTQSFCDFTDNPLIHRYIFDSQVQQQQGGTGQPFDWSILPSHLKHKIILAGGITLNNVEFALAQQCAGLDINSGVESRPGVKNSEKLTALFESIHRNFSDKTVLTRKSL